MPLHTTNQRVRFFARLRSLLRVAAIRWRQPKKHLDMKFVLEPNNRNPEKSELIKDIKRVANLLNKNAITSTEYNENGKWTVDTPIRYFGQWNIALEACGLEINKRMNISKVELFENLQSIWVKKGRQPFSSDMVKPYSQIDISVYKRNFGSWRNALEAFVEFINTDDDNNEIPIFSREIIKENEDVFKHKTKRFPSDKIKMQVVMKDRNACKSCGCKLAGWEELYFDHIKPWSKGGETILENLQILCIKCNLLKGTLEYPEK
jgi:hypothetical protein